MDKNKWLLVTDELQLDEVKKNMDKCLGHFTEAILCLAEIGDIATRVHASIAREGHATSLRAHMETILPRRGTPK